MSQQAILPSNHLLAAYHGQVHQGPGVCGIPWMGSANIPTTGILKMLVTLTACLWTEIRAPRGNVRYTQRACITPHTQSWGGTRTFNPGGVR